MTVWVALLRGINLGKRQMKMAELRACVEEAGFGAVKTVLASGNVRFESEDGTGIAARLEAAMEQRFGFAVKVVLRSADEIEAMLAADPFATVDPEADVALHVLFARDPLTPKPDLSGLPAHVEVAHVAPREIFLVAHRLPNGRYTEGLDSIDRLLPKGALITMRNWNTIGKLLA